MVQAFNDFVLENIKGVVAVCHLINLEEEHIVVEIFDDFVQEMSRE